MDLYRRPRVLQRPQPPIALVSASSESSATSLISEIIDGYNSRIQCQENNPLCAMWLISNKYYYVDVCMWPYSSKKADGLPKPDRVEAHIIYLTEKECAGPVEELVKQRVELVRSVGICGHDSVRLVAAECTELPPALINVAAELHYEPVPMRLPPASEQDDEENIEADYGFPRLRNALHAHTWSDVNFKTDISFNPRLLKCTKDSNSSASSSSSEDEDFVADVQLNSGAQVEEITEQMAALRAQAEHWGGRNNNEIARQADNLFTAFFRAVGIRPR